ncbi:nucleotide-binding alpha-beta plait domain-containing protein [Tanacetum coccineum]
MKGKSTTFFFTGFPESWNEKNLWEMFKKYGTVVDLYLAHRRTKVGTRFGFVRFINVGDISECEKKLRNINVGNTKLLINIAKYDKAGQNISQNKKGDNQQSDWKWTFRDLEAKPQKEQNDWKWTFGKKDSKSQFEPCNVKKTFKDAIVGTHGNEKNHKGEEEKGIVIEARANTTLLARLKSCWVGKARNIHALRNIWTLFKQEGLVGCTIHYLGGLTILCEWQSEAKALECLDLNKVNLSFWLSNLDMWNENLEPPGRLTWLEIEGLPTLVWDPETVNRIGAELGVVLEIDDMKFECPMKNSVGVLVLSKCMDDISRSVSIKVNGRIHHIRVVEDRNRSTLLNFPKKTDEEPSEEETDESSGEDDSDGVSETEFDNEGDQYNEAPRELEKVGEVEASHTHASPSQVMSSFEVSVEEDIDYGSNNKEKLPHNSAGMKNEDKNIASSILKPTLTQ